jgi:hypothetical protein
MLARHPTRTRDAPADASGRIHHPTNVGEVPGALAHREQTIQALSANFKRARQTKASRAIETQTQPQ